MKTKLFIFLLICNLIVFAQQQPVAPVKVVTDEYFGQKIDDPYRYMEDLKDPVVKKWFKGQADYSRNVLDHISGRDELIEKFKELDSRQSNKIFRLRITENDLYFYLKETPNDETGKLFYRKGFKGKEQLLFDPEKYKPKDGDQHVISSIFPNFDGSKISFSIAKNGAESATILVMNVENKKLYKEEIEPCWSFATSWLPDGNSFFYGRYNSSDVTDKTRQLNTKVYLHNVGTNSTEDIEVFSSTLYPDLKIKPEEIPILIYDKDCDKIFCEVYTVDSNLKVFIADNKDISNNKVKWNLLVKRSDKIENIYTDKKSFYYKTSKNASNYKIISTSIDNPDLSNAKLLISENKDEVLNDFKVTNKGFYYTTMKNGVDAKVYHKKLNSPTSKEIKLPFAAGRASIRAKGVNYDDIWITINGWTLDYRRFRYIPDNNSFVPEELSSIAEFPEFKNFVVEEVMIPSHDGVKVPLSIIHKKNLQKNGNTPLLLFGYGSYGASISPFFYNIFLSWVDEGGILAIAHVRGGGELGDAWYKAGYKTTKPNTWKDFIASAEYLNKKKYSSPEKTIIYSSSAGGILVGRAMIERPDLFAVAVPAVGAMNPVRMENSPNGPVNVPEFGTVKIEEEFKALVEMDSYLQLKKGVKYPATLVTAGMNDPRVVAWQPGKYTARLQAVNASENPILFRVDYDAGHGIGDSKTKTFEEFADIFSFAFWQTGHPDYQAIKTDDIKLQK